jgi:ABC-type sugar transport system permease subunit
MDSNLKLTLIRIFLALKIVFNILLIVGGTIAAAQISKFQFWSDHSNKVINEIEVVRKQFQTADYTGRNRNLTGVESNDLQGLRSEALSSLDRLKTIMPDNQKQIEHLDQLKREMIGLFAVRDEQFRNVKRENGSIIYPSDSVMKNVTYLESIETLFYEIKMVEINLLRLERAPTVFRWQWYTIYFTGIVIIVSLAVTIYLNIVLQRHVIKGLMLARKMEKAKDAEEKEFVKVPIKTFNAWMTDLQGE